jgi:hypothetical protein
MVERESNLIALWSIQRLMQPIKAHTTVKPVLFLHPKDFSGTLVELEQA